MKEKNSVLIIMLVLLILGLINLLFFSFFSEFNFYKSELTISGTEIKERLYYQPDKDYHTLFRNFQDPLHVKQKNYQENNYIQVESVSCQDGEEYAKDYSTTYTGENLSISSYIPFTEPNEYGCSFGSAAGFSKGSNYWIESIYSLHTKNLFKIKDKYYIKFIAYSRDKHKLLIKNQNFFVNQGITKSIYLSGDYVIVYIQYSGDISNFNIIEKSNFEFDNSLRVLLIIAIIPPFLFFFLWFLLGREKSFIDLPSTLSYYPQERKAWEVAAYFQPPFSVVDKEFFSSMILDFKRKKIIDIKDDEEKETYIKLNKYPPKMDEVESKFYALLVIIEDIAKPENKKLGYFNLNKVLKQWFSAGKIQTRYKALEIDKKIKETGKEYIDNKIKYLFPALLILCLLSINLFSFSSRLKFFIFPVIYLSILISIIYRQTAILIHFKKDYYREYQQWQAFRNYLKSFPSMRNSPPEAVRLWDIYLTYATALGVSKEVLKAFKNWKIIDERQFVLYSHSILISSSLTTSSGSSGSHGGGFGGAGGGGVGGGGGGGR